MLTQLQHSDFLIRYDLLKLEVILVVDGRITKFYAEVNLKQRFIEKSFIGGMVQHIPSTNVQLTKLFNKNDIDDSREGLFS